jgi:hypothetical protein
LLELGDDSLKGSRYLWLRNPDNLDAAGTGALNALHQMNLKTSRAWALKETAMCLWRLVQRGRAATEWRTWIAKAMRSRLEPVKKVARMIRKYLWGIVNAMALRTTNAGSEDVRRRRCPCHGAVSQRPSSGAPTVGFSGLDNGSSRRMLLHSVQSNIATRGLSDPLGGFFPEPARSATLRHRTLPAACSHYEHLTFDSRQGRCLWTLHRQSLSGYRSRCLTTVTFCGPKSNQAHFAQT